jgi:hypothetical protein
VTKALLLVLTEKRRGDRDWPKKKNGRSPFPQVQLTLHRAQLIVELLVLHQPMLDEKQIRMERGGGSWPLNSFADCG